MRCAECKHFETGDDHCAGNVPGSGHCSRWHEGYGDVGTNMKSNECWVEDDEGWGNIVGPDFGCVLFEPKG